MNSLLVICCAIVSSYLIGAIPTSFILGKALKGIDIRQVGSGNVGATNVLRMVGRLPALIALVVDILKGILVVTFIVNYSYRFIGGVNYDFYRALLGFIAICGHIWPVFLRFKGGKGVAATIGVSAVIMPLPLLLAGAVWVTVFAFTSYVSLSSIALGLALPIFAALLNQPFSIIAFAVALCFLNGYKHKSNIGRLLRGQEDKVGLFKKLS